MLNSQCIIEASPKSRGNADDAKIANLFKLEPLIFNKVQKIYGNLCHLRHLRSKRIFGVDS